MATKPAPMAAVNCVRLPSSPGNGPASCAPGTDTISDRSALADLHRPTLS